MTAILGNIIVVSALMAAIALVVSQLRVNVATFLGGSEHTLATVETRLATRIGHDRMRRDDDRIIVNCVTEIIDVILYRLYSRSIEISIRNGDLVLVARPHPFKLRPTSRDHYIPRKELLDLIEATRSA